MGEATRGAAYGRLTLTRDPDDPAQDGILLWAGPRAPGVKPLAEILVRPAGEGDPRDVTALVLSGGGALEVWYALGDRRRGVQTVAGVAFGLVMTVAPGRNAFTVAPRGAPGDHADVQVYPSPGPLAAGALGREVRVVVYAPRAWRVVRRELAERDGWVARRLGRLPVNPAPVIGREGEDREGTSEGEDGGQ